MLIPLISMMITLFIFGLPYFLIFKVVSKILKIRKENQKDLSKDNLQRQQIQHDYEFRFQILTEYFKEYQYFNYDTEVRLQRKEKTITGHQDINVYKNGEYIGTLLDVYRIDTNLYNGI